MNKKQGIHIGSMTIGLPWQAFKQTKLQLSSTSAATAQYPKNQKLPAFSLSLTNGTKLSTTDLYAKPTILSFVATWSDAGRDQLSLLASAAADDINIIPVISGEAATKLQSYVAVAGYKIPVLIDTNNQLAQDMGVSAVPTHYFLDRRGAVTKILTGVFSQEELIKNATN